MSFLAYSGIVSSMIIFLVAAIQFVNVLDFVMVMPLGPDFAKELSISSAHIGWIGGSYTFAAALSGLLGSRFLDRFDRKKAQAVSLLGLAVGTALGAFSTGLVSLIAARVLAGIFGGPTTSLSMSMISDAVPFEKRGRAMAWVMGSFSMASVFGVPLALELASRWGWRAPFLFVAGLIALVWVVSQLSLPSFKGHLDSPAEPMNLAFLKRPTVWMSYAMFSLAMFGGFLMIPNFSAFFQFNLNYPRAGLGGLYFIGGILSFIALRLAGVLSDKWGAQSVILLSTVLLIAVLIFGYGLVWLPPVVIFCGFMVGMSVRSVALTSLSSRVPAPGQRARYMSFQSAAQHFASSFGAFLSSVILVSEPSGKLIGMEVLVAVAVICSILIPGLSHRVQVGLKHSSH